MTGNWRRQRSDNYNQQVTRTVSHNRKPTLGCWQPTVPSWEKKFCTVVGSVPWRKLLESKKFIHLYDKVLKWNDCAGEEAFINAKNRFWAQINGLPCDISLPDPDIYIDKVDWNSNVDPELLLDLECESTVPANQEKGEQVVILGESLVPSHLFFSTGWGDAEDDLKKNGSSSEIKVNSLERSCDQANGNVRENEWENGCNDSWCENQGNQIMKECGNQGNQIMKDSGWEDGWNQWENNNYEADNRNQERSGGYMSSYKTSRFHGDDHLTKREWRNGKGRKRVNFVYERPFTDKRTTPRQWNLMNTCGPVSHHGLAKQGNQWGLEKPVS